MGSNNTTSQEAEIEALRRRVTAQETEIEALRRRVAELTAALADPQRERQAREAEQEREAALQRSRELGQRLQDIIASIPGIVFEMWREPDEALGRVNFISEQVEAITGTSARDWLKDPASFMRRVQMDPAAIERASKAASERRTPATYTYRWLGDDGREIWFESYVVPILNERGEAIGRRGVSIDVTEQRRVREERQRLQEEIIRAQAAALEQLSTPLIPISDEVLVMPLVGSIDKARADRILETLLEGITRARARTAILDVTGVPKIDPPTAAALIRAARAVELLGASVLLTGLRPEVARTLVGLGVDLGGIVTAGTLQGGIRLAITRCGG